MEGKEIIKATVVQYYIWNQIVIFGYMVSGYHATTLEDNAPPRNPSKKTRQNVPTPWGDSGGTSTTSWSDTDRGSKLGTLI